METKFKATDQSYFITAKAPNKNNCVGSVYTWTILHNTATINQRDYHHLILFWELSGLCHLAVPCAHDLALERSKVESTE